MSGKRGFARFLLVAVVTAAVTAGVQPAVAGTAAADPPSGHWAKLRQCESNGQYTIVAAHGG